MADRPERRGRKGRKKVCNFCVENIKEIDYKDVCAFHQRQLTVAIKRARHVALMPYTAD